MTTDTPRTNAAYKDHAWDLNDHIPLEFAQQLERELNAHKKDALKGLELADEWAAKCVKAESEVERLKAAINSIEDYGTEAISDAIKLRSLLDRSVEIARTFLKLSLIETADLCDWHFEDQAKAMNDFSILCKEIK